MRLGRKKQDLLDWRSDGSRFLATRKAAREPRSSAADTETVSVLTGWNEQQELWRTHTCYRRRGLHLVGQDDDFASVRFLHQPLTYSKLAIGAGIASIAACVVSRLLLYRLRRKVPASLLFRTDYLSAARRR